MSSVHSPINYAFVHRDRPILLVHGEQGHSETEMKRDASQFPNISLCRVSGTSVFSSNNYLMK